MRIIKKTFSTLEMKNKEYKPYNQKLMENSIAVQIESMALTYWKKLSINTQRQPLFLEDSTLETELSATNAFG